MGKYYLTMAIPYINDRPHIGHALLATLTDIVARYKKQTGYQIFFTTGTDEHGLKVKQAANKAGKNPQKFADEMAAKFKSAWQLLDINYHCFLRTTNPQHQLLAQKFLQKLYAAGYIYADTYAGLYCIGCEKFLTASDLDRNKCCPLHKPEQTIRQKEQNYFFKLSAFALKLRKLIATDEFMILPAERKKEILARIDQGVEDISISRERLDWGVKIPWDKTQTIYVWVEALLNYWTIPRIVKKTGLWPPDLQLIGKDILWFHAVIWPALLLAAAEELPKRLFAHSFLLLNGAKMSKSLGNIITPQELVGRYGADGARYLLAKSLPYSADADVSWHKFDIWYNADLANGLGNLVARTAALVQKAGLNFTNKLKRQKAQQFYPEVTRHLTAYRFDRALAFIWEKKITGLDKLIDKQQPWKLNGKELSRTLTDLVAELDRIAFNLKPFMPRTAAAIIKRFSATAVKRKALFPRIKTDWQPPQ